MLFASRVEDSQRPARQWRGWVRSSYEPVYLTHLHCFDSHPKLTWIRTWRWHQLMGCSKLRCQHWQVVQDLEGD